MTDSVRQAYDANAELYASLFLDELERDRQSTRWLTELAEVAAERQGPVVDLGCGPGSVVRFLSERDLVVTGIDLSPGQIAEARRAFPGLAFEVGDFLTLEVEAVPIPEGGRPFDHTTILARKP